MIELWIKEPGIGSRYKKYCAGNNYSLIMIYFTRESGEYLINETYNKLDAEKYYKITQFRNQRFPLIELIDDFSINLEPKKITHLPDFL